MAVDGTGAFENDDARDFLDELAEEPTLETLTAAFADAATEAPGAYVDVAEGATTVAAVAVLLVALSDAAVERPLRAQTVARVRKCLATRPAARRAWAIELARRALLRATGPSSELAEQWDELAGAKRAWRRDVERMNAKLARHYDALTLRLAKKQPRNAPPEAFFDREEGQWKVEPRDARGRDHGIARWYRPDGTLELTQTYEHGVLSGPWARYHESGEIAVSGTYARGAEQGTTTYLRSKTATSEVAFDAFADLIVRIECDWVRGALKTTRWFDAKGNLVTPEGERWPARPRAVPKEATFNATEGWIFGPTASDPPRRHGTWRFWDRAGKLVKTLRYRNGDAVR